MFLEIDNIGRRSKDALFSDDAARRRYGPAAKPSAWRPTGGLRPFGRLVLRFAGWMLTVAAVSTLSAACNPFTPQPRASISRELDTRYSLYTGEAVAMTRWWEHFSAPDLNALINDALGGNFSIKESWARLAQAQARAVQAGAAIYPGLEGSAGATMGRQHTDTTGSKSLETGSVGLVSRYEIDLWGRIRSEREAALLEATASREDVNAAAVSLAAEVTDRWLRLVAQRQQIALLERQLKVNQTFLELIELRFRKAMVSALDVYQQKQVVDGIIADIPLARRQEQLLVHELALLAGRPPQAGVQVTSTELPPVQDLPPAGVPADLLANRPDVRAAGRRLTAAEWQVAAARANRLPAINLTATARYGESDLNELFNNWLLSLSGSLTAPLFDGGRREAEVARSRARTDETLWAYRQTVYAAVKEVEDAMVSETRQREHISGLETVSGTSRRALEEAVSRYRNGLSDYLPVLTQLLAVQNLERELILQKSNLLQYRVGLYRALGGTWPSELLPPDAAATRRPLQETNTHAPQHEHS